MKSNKRHSFSNNSVEFVASCGKSRWRVRERDRGRGSSRSAFCVPKSSEHGTVGAMEWRLAIARLMKMRSAATSAAPGRAAGRVHRRNATLRAPEGQWSGNSRAKRPLGHRCTHVHAYAEMRAEGARREDVPCSHEHSGFPTPIPSSPGPITISRAPSTTCRTKL